jgi:hypothetical protein
LDVMKKGQDASPSRGIGLEGSFFPGWSAVYGLEGITGPDALMNPYYRELTGVSPIARIWDWRLLLTRDTVKASRPFLDFLNVRYYFSMPRDGPLDSGLHLDAHDDLDIYESPSAWPRAFFTNRVATYSDPAELLQLIVNDHGQPFAAIQSGEAEKDALKGLSFDASGREFIPAAGYILTERTTSFTLHASGPGMAVLNETYWPGYAHAKVNGVETKILRINHAFQGVAIEKAGEYHVKFSYEPPFFWVSVGLALGGLGLLIASLKAAQGLDAGTVSQPGINRGL